jgi:hypothetical protein
VSNLEFYLTFDNKFSAKIGGGFKSATANASKFKVLSIWPVYQRCSQLDEKRCHFAELCLLLRSIESFFILKFYRV